MSNEISLLLVIALSFVSLVISASQSTFSMKAGSDHPVHQFLVDALRQNGHKLFEYIPGILNRTYCGALPLYLHLAISYLPSRVIPWLQQLLNPFMNMANVLIVGLIAHWAQNAYSIGTEYVAYTVLLFALTPQFSHALSARNFGLSARGIGLVLLTAFFSGCVLVETDTSNSSGWLLLITSAFLIWGLSTFAQQTIVFVGILLLVIFQKWVPLVGVVIGLLIFLMVNPKYSTSYLVYTLRFIMDYRRVLAPVYILRKRESIWLDLFGEIWSRFRGGFIRGALYAYENSVLVTVLLNPLALLTVIFWLTIDGIPPVIGYAAAISVSGFIVAVGTSIRPTRFLGEPERYIEAVTPWTVLAAVYVFAAKFSLSDLDFLVAYFMVAATTQLFASWQLMRHVSSGSSELEQIAGKVEMHVKKEVRFCSNNEQLTKLLLRSGWQFAVYLVVGQTYCGMRANEAFSTFPNLEKKALEQVLNTYRINACLLDRSVYEDIFAEAPAQLESKITAYESDRYRLLIMQWRDASTAS
jgi:hypothetical protein